MAAVRVYAILLLAFASLLAITHWGVNRVPFANPNAPQHEFSEIRALNNTNALVELGYRIIGTTTCDVDSVRYLLSVLNDVQVVEGGPLLEISVQSTSGSFHSDWLHTPITSVFTNVTNIIVRLRNPITQAVVSPADMHKQHLHSEVNAVAATVRHTIELIETNQSHNRIRSSVSTGYKERHSEYLQQSKQANGVLRNAIMVSSHYDSTFNSPGASDDGTPVGVMLELIRNFAATPLSAGNPARETPLVFVFNGAEEPGMQAAFGFIAQHPWASSIRMVINLEAAGAGGRELLFQTGPRNSWIARAYTGVPSPTGSVVAQDIFQKAKAVPGDTDFSIYRDFGDIPGVDMAFIEKGHVYHTRYDDMSNVKPGSAQSMGINVKALIESISERYLRNITTLETEIDPTEEVVFFDIFGTWFIVYSVDFAEKLHFSLVAVAITAFIIELFSLPANTSKFGFVVAVIVSSISTIVTFLSGIISAALVAGFMIFALDWRMSWYGHHYIMFGLYVPASLIGFAVAQALLRWLLLQPLLAPASSITEATTKPKNKGVKVNKAATASVSTVKPANTDMESIYEAAVFWGCQLFSLSILILATVTHVASGYVLFLMALFSLLGRCIIGRLLFADHPSVEQFVTLFLSAFNTMWVSMGLAKFAVPIFGRSGPIVESDIAAAVVVTFMTFMILLPRGLSLIQRAGRFCTVALLSVAVITVSVFLALQVSPYSRDAPKRIIAKHMHYLESDSAKVESSYISLGAIDCISIEKSGLVDTLQLGPTENIPQSVSVREYQMYYPLGAFIGAVKLAVANRTSIPDAERTVSRVEPSVSLLRDSITVSRRDDDSGIVAVQRNMTISFDAGSPACWAGLNVSALNVVSWSLTDALPLPNEDAFFSIRKIGRGSYSFDVSLYNEKTISELPKSVVEAAAKSSSSDRELVMRSVLGIFNVEISAACFDRYPNEVAYDRIEAKQPEWAAVRAYDTFIRSYAF